MIHNQTLANTWCELGNLTTMWKEAVKKRLGWKSDNPFYNRITGKQWCTPAEREVFIQTLSELQINKPQNLFPEVEKAMMTAE